MLTLEACRYSRPIPVWTGRNFFKAVLLLRIESPSLREWTPSETPSQDARILLDVCKTLRSRRSQEPCPDGNISLENDLCVLVGNVLHDLGYSTILMLALITWHFGASSSEVGQGLITFLKRPHNIGVRRILHDRYQNMMCETAPSNLTFCLSEIELHQVISAGAKHELNYTWVDQMYPSFSRRLPMSWRESLYQSFKPLCISYPKIAAKSRLFSYSCRYFECRC